MQSTLHTTSDMSRLSNVFDVNVSYIVNNDFNDFRSFLIFSDSSVHVDVYNILTITWTENFIITIFNQNLSAIVIIFNWRSCFHSLKETINSFKKWPLNLWHISNKTIMEVENIIKSATFKSFLHLSNKNTQLLFFVAVLFNIFIRQTLIDDFLGSHKNMNCAFPLI